MTKQEKREKAIEDLESLANKACRAISDAYDACTDLCFPCRLLLGEFADYIIRKEEEVRKETAKEFIELFHKYVMISEDTFDGTVKMKITDVIKMNEEIENRFGVEV